MKWHADIQAVDNGFMVDYCDEEGKKRVVYKENDDYEGNINETDKTHVVEMLWDLLDFFASSGCKWDKKKINITYEVQK